MTRPEKAGLAWRLSVLANRTLRERTSCRMEAPQAQSQKTAPTAALVPYPVKVFEIELLEDGVSAFQLVPPHSPQVWQQLVPLLSS